jgi:hypothetical protein
MKCGRGITTPGSGGESHTLGDLVRAKKALVVICWRCKHQPLANERAGTEFWLVQSHPPTVERRRASALLVSASL